MAYARPSQSDCSAEMAYIAERVQEQSVKLVYEGASMLSQASAFSSSYRVTGWTSEQL
jgi:hypothetical protein